MSVVQQVTAPELPWIWSGVAAYALATIAAACERIEGRAMLRAGTMHRVVLSALGLALVLLGAGLAARWHRIGHGPFVSLFEVLTSTLFTLGIVYAAVYWRMRSVRETAIVVLPVLLLMAVWLIVTSAADTHLPPTYDTPVLWFHVTFGKLFLGCALVATGFAGAILMRRVPRFARWFRGMPANAILDGLAWKFVLAALVFESFMLIAGAVWAQDAWGRYWAWDPLETWSFTTWIAVSAAVHARLSLRISRRAGAALIVVLFALAFFTFLGVPFVSVAPHKGAL